MKDSKDVLVRLRTEQYEKLRELAYKNRQSQAEIIRAALDQYFKKEDD